MGSVRYLARHCCCAAQVRTKGHRLGLSTAPKQRGALARLLTALVSQQPEPVKLPQVSDGLELKQPDTLEGCALMQIADI